MGSANASSENPGTLRLLGSGGYNAALIAELVGPTGSVTTLDIDPEVTDRATRFLTGTGYDHVRVITADAEHLPANIVPDVGFDAIMVTVGTWDLPWIHALKEGGRLVAPLRLHQYVWAIGFTKRDGALHSDEPLIVCGFVAMQGAGAWNANQRTIPGTGIHLAWEDGTSLPVDQLAPAFAREPCVARTNVTVGGQEPFDALTLYLAGALPGFCRLSVDPDGDNCVLNPPPRHWPGAAIVRGASLARLATERIADGDDGNGVYEMVVHGYGPAGQLAAEEMAEMDIENDGWTPLRSDGYDLTTLRLMYPFLAFVLFEASHAGLEFHQLVRVSNLSASQVRSGLAALKDQAAEKSSRKCDVKGEASRWSSWCSKLASDSSLGAGETRALDRHEGSRQDRRLHPQNSLVSDTVRGVVRGQTRKNKVRAPGGCAAACPSPP